MPYTRITLKRLLIAAVVLVGVAGVAHAVIHPIISNGPFLFTGFMFGSSSFGTGNFGQ